MKFVTEFFANVPYIALFIYSIGYVAGPSFVHAFSRKAWRQVAEATFIAAVALVTAFACAYFGRLDLGTAAGLASGAVTRSAIIGTAGSAIQALHLPAAVKATLTDNLTIAYAITYLFGRLGAILMIIYVTPFVARQSLGAAAKEIEDKLSGGQSVAYLRTLEACAVARRDLVERAVLDDVVPDRAHGGSVYGRAFGGAQGRKLPMGSE